MGKSREIIIKEIDAHLEGSGCSGEYYSDYYVGIAKDPKDRLFNDHNVPTENHCYIYRKAISHSIAREVEKHYLDLGMKGGGGGGDETSKFVYVYRISNVTKE